MTILLGVADDTLERYRFALGEDITLVQQPLELDDALAQRPGEELIVIGPGVPMATAISVAERFRTSRPSVGVLLIRNRLEVGVLTEALRSGIREVVPADNGPALVAACQRSLSVSRAFDTQGTGGGDRRATTILVFSAKGGCGKTTVSTNLAMAIAKESGGTVCLVDFDLQFGDVAVALQVEPTRTMSDVLRMAGHVDRQATESLVVPYKEGVDLILAPTNPADVELITSDMAKSLLNSLQALYDYVVIDSAPAFTEVILAAFEASDYDLLLTTLDMPAIKNLKVTIDTLNALGMPDHRWRVVVNRADTRTGLSVADVEAAIGIPVAFEIPHSEAVPASTNEGITIVERDPRHSVSKTFTAMARRIVSQQSEEVAPRRLFRRRRP
jgi:pilus assembly protein CpaE